MEKGMWCIQMVLMTKECSHEASMMTVHYDMQILAADMVNEKARGIINKFGYPKMMHAWGHQPPTTLTLHNYPKFLTEIDMPGKA
jgi:hypothetical protein